MSLVLSALQSYSNIAQSSDAQMSIMNNNQMRMDAVKSLDMNVIQSLGPSDPTVASLNKSDKKAVMQNASNSFKKLCLDAWSEDLDTQKKKQAEEEFKIFE